MIAGALVAVIIGAVALAANPWAIGRAGAVVTRRAPGPDPRCTLPAKLAKGRIVVAAVVDFGGSNGRIIVSCVVTRPGDTGAQVLQAQAELLGYPTPRYDQSGSGLLCAIDGYPKSGCGTQNGSHYAYWAYWHAGKRWQYASGGPGEWKVSRGDVEGWRFEPDGSATPADPPPRAASTAADLEAPASVATTTTASKANAPGPVDQSGGRGKGANLLPFILGAVLIVLIGFGTLLRSRRPSDRVA